jgi:hypothetical protein
MTTKRLIVPQRERQLPAHWSWIDHRLVREDYMKGCSPRAWTLYLFLLCVGDAQGLSYYSDRSAARALGWSTDQLGAARAQLIAADLVAYQKPLYQVLELGSTQSQASSPRTGESLSLGQLLSRALEQTQGGSDD